MSQDYSFPLRVAADRYPDHPAFRYRDQHWTYRDFDQATDRLAAAFERRGFTGRRVVSLLNNEPTTVMTYLALARAGAVSVPVNPRLLPEEVAYIVDDSGASAIIADADFLDHAKHLRDRDPDLNGLITVNATHSEDAERLVDLIEGEQRAATTQVDPQSVSMLVYTSGTSGFPKGVMRTHDANRWAYVNSQLGQPRYAYDTEVFVLPLFGIAFLFQVMPMIVAGGTIVLDGAFDAARTWAALERYRATRVFLAPTMIDSMLAVDGHDSRDVSALRIVNTAYEFPERVRVAASERFGDIIAYMYGLTEAQLCCSTPEEFAEDATNAGHPMGMMRVKVVGEDRNPVGTGVVGEIAMAGPSVMQGYHGRSEATADVLADGWLYTGDLGYLDDHGRVHVAGRLKEIIKTGGVTVDPVEVENTILRFPGVREAAVVGAPHEHWGEQVVAFVSAEPGAVSERELRAFVKARLAGFKCPKQMWLVADLPKNPTGKIQRGRLRDQAAAGMARQQ